MPDLLTPFGAHVLHHATMVGLLAIALALVAETLRRTWR